MRHICAFGRAAVLLAGLFLVIGLVHSIAQGTGSIGGTVVDKSRLPLPVLASHSSTREPRKHVSSPVPTRRQQDSFSSAVLNANTPNGGLPA